ncbi:hypothetical protein G6F36_015727 [Rhizopus arrhizus]|nr:hypothetical protein G6F36_015727 [Rhizopus arrhizus]KAG1523562.1 hypothetical protein G6F52_004922 [Rhizopus delemar]
MPTFFKNFTAISHLIEATYVILDYMFSTVDKTQNILEEDNEDPSPHVSPRKKRKYTSSKAKDEAGSQEEE